MTTDMLSLILIALERDTKFEVVKQTNYPKDSLLVRKGEILDVYVDFKKKQIIKHCKV